MSDLDENKALVRRYFEEFFNDRALDGAADVCATDYTEHALAPFGDAEPGAVDGPEHVRRTVAWLTDQYPDLRMDIEALVAEDDLVVARVLSVGTYTGRHTRREPPTGRSLQLGADALVPGGRTASWPSTGRPGTTCGRCSSSA